MGAYIMDNNDFISAYFDHSSLPHGIVQQFFEACGTENIGLTTVLPLQKMQEYQLYVQSWFPELSNLMLIIGYDWMGRPYGLSKSTSNIILLYDSIFDELMEFNASSYNIFSSPLFDVKFDNFGCNDFHMFLSANKLTFMPLDTCAGFIIPPQLGGNVSVDNMELYNVKFYWKYISLMHEVYDNLPDGTMLRSIETK